MNRNKVCSSSTSKSPELLARFCDALLRKGSKNPEDNDMEDTLTNIVGNMKVKSQLTHITR